MRFEYTRILVPVENVIEEMNRLGDDGWQAINTRHLDPHFNTPTSADARRQYIDHQRDQDLVAVLFERIKAAPPG